MRNILFICLTWSIPIDLLANSAPFDMEKVVDKADVVIVEKLDPNYLSVDANGDGKADIVLFVETKSNQKMGLCIIHSGSNGCLIIGAGKGFYHGKDNFDWVDSWSIVPAGKTWETTFAPDGDVLDTKEVILMNQSIHLCEDEGGCAVITFMNGKYIWVHQGD